MPATISAVIITRNEEAEIGDCLDSVAFCDERIVLDCGSTDDTVAIARARGAAVHHQDWLGFGRQKNAAIALASGDWILSIDADERATAALAAEIRETVETGRHDGYEIPRLGFFCGRPIKSSGWWPDYTRRLFRRGKARFSELPVHERAEIDGAIGRLSAHLLHYAIRDLDQVTDRVHRYSTLGAERIVDSGRRVGFHSGITHAMAAFVKMYVLRGGFRDGRAGFLVAASTAHGAFYRYMKAWMAQRPTASRKD